MPPRKTKFVTLKISSNELSKYPELAAHVWVKPKRKVPKAKLKQMNMSINNNLKNSKDSNNTNTEQSPSLSTEESQKLNETIDGSGNNNPLTNNGTGSVYNPGAKLSSNVRVGISGLTMNTSIIRELDRSGRVVSNWAKFDSKTAENEKEENGDQDITNIGGDKEGSNEIIKDENTDVKLKDFKLPDVEELDSNKGVVSMKDYRGYKDSEIQNRQNAIVSKALNKGRKVVRSFSGYVMLWPSWHRVKEGELQSSSNMNDASANGGSGSGSQLKRGLSSTDISTNKGSPGSVMTPGSTPALIP